MNLGAILLFLFVGIPCIELYCFATLGAQLGLPTTLLVIIGTGMIGAWLAKREGLAAWQRVQQCLARGRDPSREIYDGLLILVAGIALLIPGFFTDVVGLLLLLPPVRLMVAALLRQHWRPALGKTHFPPAQDDEAESSGNSSRNTQSDSSEIIDIDATRRD
ncbi:MAG: FxsA family protein [Victivallales bacterium]|nr:FxsA family protein [Victivallales bacterium]